MSNHNACEGSASPGQSRESLRPWKTRQASSARTRTKVAPPTAPVVRCALDVPVVREVLAVWQRRARRRPPRVPNHARSAIKRKRGSTTALSLGHLRSSRRSKCGGSSTSMRKAGQTSSDTNAGTTDQAEELSTGSGRHRGHPAPPLSALDRSPLADVSIVQVCRRTQEKICRVTGPLPNRHDNDPHRSAADRLRDRIW